MSLQQLPLLMGSLKADEGKKHPDAYLGGEDFDLHMVNHSVEEEKVQE